jgi:hypothetical protein
MQPVRGQPAAGTICYKRIPVSEDVRILRVEFEQVWDIEFEATSHQAEGEKTRDMIRSKRRQFGMQTRIPYHVLLDY